MIIGSCPTPITFRPAKQFPTSFLHLLQQRYYLDFTSGTKKQGRRCKQILWEWRYIIKLMQSKDREFGEPNLDLRQHVDWMKSYSQEAWQDLQERVARMGSVLRSHHRQIPKAELNHQAYQAQLQQLIHTLHQTTNRQQLLHQDIKNIRLDVAKVQEGHIHLREESQDTQEEINTLRNNYARVSTDMKTINKSLHEFKGQLKQAHRDINEFKSKANKDVKTVNENLNNIREKTEKIDKKNDGEIFELKKQFDRKIDGEFNDFKKQIEKKINQWEKNTKKISKDLIKEQKSRIAQLREKIMELSEGMNKVKGDMNGLRVGIQDVKINLIKVAEDAAKNAKNIKNNAEAIRRQINEVNQNCQRQKNEVFFKIDGHRSILQSSIREAVNTREQVEVLSFQLDQESIRRNKEVKTIRSELSIQLSKIDQEWKWMIRELGLVTLELDKKERKERIKKIMKQNPEQLINKATPYAANFRLHNNTITLEKHLLKEDNIIYAQQLLMNVVMGRVFTFTIRIVKSTSGQIAVGVVDREKQKEAQSSYRSGNAVCYGTHREKGQIGYGEGGEFKWKDTDDRLKQGMKVKVEVEEDTVRFSLTETGWFETRKKVHVITSPILSHPRPQFVPFVQMWKEGDSVEWQIQ